ncbi:helix-turn-helix domain-containing protein [Labrenzia sp. DG1229]|uniref:helix-turn-helix domain-containing protein n=1 Tax=Labrenzia sp. DG1229 TaxID=681847 RepID=UPI00056CEDD8|nr:helix-turn-helix domain-containing protein [Labrenzia sp. DG1229]
MTSAIPAHIETYVEILGEELAIEFFLRFGGSEQYFSKSPKHSMMLELTGLEKLTMLTERLGCGHVRVPIPKPWIAGCLYFRGASQAEIARRLHVDQRTVGRWFAKGTNRDQFCLLL